MGDTIKNNCLFGKDIRNKDTKTVIKRDNNSEVDLQETKTTSMNKAIIIKTNEISYYGIHSYHLFI
jgi:hypothetical protein